MVPETLSAMLLKGTLFCDMCYSWARLTSLFVFGSIWVGCVSVFRLERSNVLNKILLVSQLIHQSPSFSQSRLSFRKVSSEFTYFLRCGNFVSSFSDLQNEPISVNLLLAGKICAYLSLSNCCCALFSCAMRRAKRLLGHFLSLLDKGKWVL